MITMMSVYDFDLLHQRTICNQQRISIMVILLIP